VTTRFFVDRFSDKQQAEIFRPYLQLFRQFPRCRFLCRFACILTAARQKPVTPAIFAVTHEADPPVIAFEQHRNPYPDRVVIKLLHTYLHRQAAAQIEQIILR
jgi:hypothetical protein